MGNGLIRRVRKCSRAILTRYTGNGCKLFRHMIDTSRVFVRAQLSKVIEVIRSQILGRPQSGQLSNTGER